nr:unnamed protein product [Spirometra erinaceieuropaei]
MIKDAVDDIKRHLNDRKVNLRPYLVWKHFEETQDSGWRPVAAKKIRPGDLVLCKENEAFPCDLIVLATSNSNGKVYETTGNLDGESAIKTIYSLATTQKPFSEVICGFEAPEEVKQIRQAKFPPTKIICQQPTDDFKVDDACPVLRVHVDAVIEFDSVRKRMSVMVRQEDGQCFVYTKGAEVAMLDARLCSATPSEVRDSIIEKVTNFACLGLRTLVFGMRELKPQSYEKLLAELRYAQGLIGQERTRELQAVHGKIESSMTLVGVSAVEDKLQPGVRRCLRSLLSAGIQVWVLTGDKEETAVQVSQAAGHFPPGLSLIRLTGGQSLEDVARAIYVQKEGMRTRLKEKKRRLRWRWPSTAKRPSVDFKEPYADTIEFSSSDSEEEVEVCNPASGPSLVQRMTNGFNKAVTGSLRRLGRKHPGEANEAVGLVIDGKTLRFATSPVLRKDFLKLCMSVTTVLCCRVTPLQKASVVRLVRKGLKRVNGGSEPVTAAIGDGGNDVAMLLEASVGLGIFGNEGRQAARSSDYAISLFKYLRRLVLVHGHWSYYRVSTLALLFYFKSVAFVGVHIYHMFYNGFSGQSLFESLIYTIFNLTMVAWSPFCFALFEQHVSAKDLLHRPYLYRLMTKNANLSACAVGAVLHQQVNNQLQPLAFFSQKLQPAQTRCSTFSRELLAIYLAIRHFRHLLEGRDFSIHTNHKPLTYALKTKPDRYSPREVRHLDYISQFTADIRYVQSSDNVAADALSRPDINTLTSDFDLMKLADLQSGDKSIDDLRSTTILQLRDAPIPASPGTILCVWSTGTPRPVVPLSYRKTVFEHFHSLSYPGIRASRKQLAARYIWPKMNSDIALWTTQCLACQKNKVHRHTFTPPSTFTVSDVRFHHVHLDLFGPLPPSRG